MRSVRTIKSIGCLTCSGMGGGGGKSFNEFICCVICRFKWFKLLIWLFSCAMTNAFGSIGMPLAFSCGEPDRDVLWLRAKILAATDALPLVIACMCGGDVCIFSIGTGGGGGNASRPCWIFRLRVGVFAFDAFGVLPITLNKKYNRRSRSDYIN